MYKRQLLLQYFVYFTQFIYVLPDTKAMVNIVIILGIFALIRVKDIFSTPAIPGRHPIPRDRATAPSPTHTAALAITERTGVAANSASDDFSKLPSRRWQVITTSYVASTAERSIPDRASGESPCLCIVVFFLLYCCTIIVYTWWNRGLLVDRFFCCTLRYRCTMVHASWMVG